MKQKALVCMISMIPALLCHATGYGKTATLYDTMIQRKIHEVRLVIVIVVTHLNLYHIGPGATFV